MLVASTASKDSGHWNTSTLHVYKELIPSRRDPAVTLAPCRFPQVELSFGAMPSKLEQKEYEKITKYHVRLALSLIPPLKTLAFRSGRRG